MLLVWYAGAYTVQTNTVPLNTGRKVPFAAAGSKSIVGISVPRLIFIVLSQLGRIMRRSASPDLLSSMAPSATGRSFLLSSCCYRQKLPFFVVPRAVWPGMYLDSPCFRG